MRTKQIKKWLIDQDFIQADIVRDLGCSRNLVWKTVNGIERNRRVIEWLIRHGCPERYVEFPRK